MAAIAELRRAALAHALVLFWAFFVLGVALLPVGSLVTLANAARLSLCAGASVTYAPAAWFAVRARRPTRGGILALGIFLTQSASAGLAAVSVLSLSFNVPVLSNRLFLLAFATLYFEQAIGALCHLNSPESVDGQIPRRQWIKVGAIVAAGLAALAIVVTARAFLPGVKL